MSFTFGNNSGSGSGSGSSSSSSSSVGPGLTINNFPQTIKLDDKITIIIESGEIKIIGASSINFGNSVSQTFPPSSYQSPPPTVRDLTNPPPPPFAAAASASARQFISEYPSYSGQHVENLDSEKDTEQCAFRKKRLINEIKITNKKLKKIQIVYSMDNYDKNIFAIFDDEDEDGDRKELVRGNILFDKSYPCDDSWKFNIAGGQTYRVSLKQNETMATLLEDRLNYIYNKYMKNPFLFEHVASIGASASAAPTDKKRKHGDTKK
jgi:hypothetical protein